MTELRWNYHLLPTYGPERVLSRLIASTAGSPRFILITE